VIVHRLAAPAVAALGLAGCAHASPPAAATPPPGLMLAEAAPASASATAPASTPSPATDSAPPVDAAAGGSETDRMVHDRQSREFARAGGWIAVGVGAAAGALALGTGAYMLSDLSTRNGNCNASKVCNAAGASANSELSGLAPWNAGAFVVAAVGLVGGGFLVLTNPAQPSQRAELGLAPTPAGGAFMLRGSF
jgi:hypothetical protein